MQKSKSAVLFQKNLKEGILSKLHKTAAQFITYEGHQEQKSLFRKKQVPISLQFAPNTQTFAVKEGIASQVPLQCFHLTEVFLICAYPTHWLSAKDKSNLYELSIIFDNQKLPELWFYMEKSVFKELEQTVIKHDKRKHFLVMKQHLPVERLPIPP